MFFKKFSDEREERDWSIVRRGRRCGSRFENRDDEARFSIKWNKARGNREVENVAEGRGNERRLIIILLSTCKTHLFNNPN